MPAPQKSLLKPIVEGLMQQNGLKGENAPDLAEAIAEITAKSLGKMMSLAKVAPGIPAAPGATAGPGKLM